MLNYSKEQFTKDRKKMHPDNKKIMDEKFKVWENISKKCNISHIINAPESLKIQTRKNKEIEGQIALSIINFVKSTKKKALDLKEIKD